jgi:hypothetical protein
MSAFISAAVLVAGSSIYVQKRAEASNKKAAKKAQKQADKDAISARKSEIFAETVGEGQGSIGEISLAVDDEIDEEEEALRQGSLRV